MPRCFCFLPIVQISSVGPSQFFLICIIWYPRNKIQVNHPPSSLQMARWSYWSSIYRFTFCFTFCYAARFTSKTDVPVSSLGSAGNVSRIPRPWSWKNVWSRAEQRSSGFRAEDFDVGRWPFWFQTELEISGTNQAPQAF